MDKLQGINKNNRSTLKEGPIENNFARISEVEPILNKVNEIVDIENKKPKVYKALLTQTGTNAPVATILENTLGYTPTYGYSAQGQYSITMSDNEYSKIFISISQHNSQGLYLTRESFTGTFDILSLDVYLQTLQDGYLLNTPITIEVYP